MLQVGIIGLGGFARSHHSTIWTLEKEGLCKLVCTCDPAPDAFQTNMAELEFEQRRVKVFDHYLKMLDEFGSKLDVVTIPTPVPLHAEMHRACVERGIAVYLEKPPTVNYTELEEMLEVESKAKKLTNVAFNFIVEKPRQEAKKRLVSGEFGAIQEVQYCGLAPRSVSYYQRANWPGKLMLDGRLVLDTCMSNAMAHHVHDALFWLGKDDVFSWGQVREAQAELYRAHDIETFDTVFTTAQTETGERLRMAISHALAGDSVSFEKVICDKAVLAYGGGGYRVEWQDGRVETREGEKRELIVENHRAYLNYVRGETDRPITRLEDSKPFVHLCDLVYIASGKIVQVPESHVDREDGFVAVRDIRAIAQRFFAENLYPSDQGIEWSRPGGNATVDDLPKLRSVIEGML